MTTSPHHSFVNRRVLKFNVGFILAQGPGYRRVMDVEFPRLQVADDLELEYLRGELRLSRNSRGILVQGEFEAGVNSECDRCLAPTLVPVEIELEELFSYPPSPEALYSVDDTGILDLSPLLREETILAIPMIVACRPDCAGLCPECGQNLNEGTCDCERDEIDPRLAVLRARLDELDEDRE